MRNDGLLQTIVAHAEGLPVRVVTGVTPTAVHSGTDSRRVSFIKMLHFATLTNLSSYQSLTQGSFP